MKFIVMLNLDMPFVDLMSALGHMSFKLGHRVKGQPCVRVIFGDTGQVRVFRTHTLSLHQTQATTSLFTDFTHNVLGLDSVQAEKDFTYAGACYAAEEIDSNLEAVLNSPTLRVLKGYTPYISPETVELLPANEKLTEIDEEVKINILLNAKAGLENLLNYLVLASLAIGRSIDYAKLPFTILQPESADIHDRIAKAADAATEIQAKTIYAGETPLVTVAFGPRVEIEAVFTVTGTSLFSQAIKPEDFVPPSGAMLFAAKSSMSANELAQQTWSLNQEIVITKLHEMLQADKPEPIRQAIISQVFREAANGGQDIIIDYFLARYARYLTSDDIQQAVQNAHANKHLELKTKLEAVLVARNEEQTKKSTSTLTV